MRDRRKIPARAACALALIACLTPALSGCNEPVRGTYVDVGGLTRYTFAQDGTAHIQVMGTVASGEYLIDGRRVILSNAQGTVVLTRHGDRLIGPMGLMLWPADAGD